MLGMGVGTEGAASADFAPAEAEQVRMVGRFSSARTGGVSSLLDPFHAAWVVFAARNVYLFDDRAGVLDRVRGVAGVLVILGVTVRYDPSALLFAPAAALDSASNTALVSIAIAVALLGIAVGVVSGERRWAALRAAARPLAMMLVAAAIIGVLVVTGEIYLSPDALPDQAELDARGTWRQGLSFVLGVWLLPFITYGTYLVARDMWGIADAHPRLAPLASLALTVFFLVVDIADLGVGGLLLDVSQPALPVRVSSALLATSAVVAVGTSVWAWWRLGRAGFTLRNGPWL